MNETFKAAIIPSVYFMNIYDQRTVGIHNRTSPFKICMKLWFLRSKLLTEIKFLAISLDSGA